MEVKNQAAQFEKWRKDKFIIEFINSPRIFDEIYSMFKDQISIDTFRWLVAYRFIAPILGEKNIWEHARPSLLYHILPGMTSTEMFYKTYKLANEKCKDFVIYTSPYCIWHTFILEQYRYEDIFHYQQGDVVFDVGGYVGDTALYFSKMVGEKGRVYTFEPDSKNQEAILENIEKFNGKNIILIDQGLSDHSGKMRFSQNGSSGASFNDKGSYISVTTLDEFVEENSIEKISVIKMDVEGAEESVLRGGLKTINKLNPILLISVYHTGDFGYEDFTRLTLILKKNCRNYDFYLRHKNAQLYETLMICIPKK